MQPTYERDLISACERLGDVEALRGATVLITGITGMIGACLADALTLLNDRQNLDMTVYGLSRNPGRMAGRFPGVILRAADLSDPSADLPEADFIVHAASNTHPAAFSADPVGTMLGNLTGTHALLERLRVRGRGRLLFVSTGEIYGENPAVTEGFSETDFGRIDPMNPRSCYPESKRASETLCACYVRQYGVDALAARLSYVYGPTINESDSRASAQFLRRAVAGEDIVLKSEGAQVRSYTYVADAISGLLTLLLRGATGEAYNVADRGGTVSIREYAEALARLAGVQVRFELPSEQERRGYSVFTRAVQKPDKLEALGWRPGVDFETGLSHTLTACREAMTKE